MEELEPAALKTEHEAVSLTLARTRKNWLANHPATNHTGAKVHNTENNTL